MKWGIFEIKVLPLQAKKDCYEIRFAKTHHIRYHIGHYIFVSGEDSSLEKDMYQKLQSIKTADKADEPIAESDSLALSLVDYYEHHGSKLKLTEAYYYAGRIFYERRDFTKSLHYYNKAASALPHSDTPDLEGVIYSQIGYVFSCQDLSDEAIKAFKHSYLFCKNQKDTLGMIYGLRDWGKELGDHGKYNEARRILLESIQLAKAKKSIIYIMATKATLQVYIANYRITKKRKQR